MTLFIIIFVFIIFYGMQFFCHQWNTWYMVYAVTGTRPNFPSTKYGGQERPTNRANVHVENPLWKGRLKQRVRIPIDPALFGVAIRHRFIATKNKLKMWIMIMLSRQSRCFSSILSARLWNSKHSLFIIKWSLSVVRRRKVSGPIDLDSNPAHCHFPFSVLLLRNHNGLFK